MTLKVNEIFYSIQGESLNLGRPCVFVRLTGCNLRCSYCDTKYAYYQGKKKNIEEIIAGIKAFKCGLVEITGGEPLLQKETPQLIYRLLEKGYEVMLETNGSLGIGCIDSRCIKIVDLKCPASGESEKNNLANLKKINRQDQLKFVVSDQKDYIFAKEILKKIGSDFPSDHVLLSPAFGKIAPDRIARWILDDHLQVRLNLQIHKTIWPDKQRGV